MEKQQISGDIIQIEKSEDSDKSWKKWTYVVRDTTGKTHYLSLFISDKDYENVRLKKEAIVSDFKKGDKISAIYTEKGTYKTLVDMQFPLEESDKKFHVNNAKPKAIDTDHEEAIIKHFSNEPQKRELTTNERILLSQCLNCATNLIAHFCQQSNEQFLMDKTPKKIIELAKKIYEEIKMSGYLEKQ